MTQLSCSQITLTTGAIVLNPGTIALRGPTDRTVLVYQSDYQPIGLLRQPNGDALLLYDLTLSGGVADHGGCVYSTGGVSMVNTTLTKCYARISGGGVFAGGYLYMRGSTITSSAAAGLYVTSATTLGGGAYVGGDFNMVSSTLSLNYAYSANFSFGGGAFTRGSVYLRYSTIRDNSAGKYSDLTHYYGSVGGISSTGAAGTVVFNSTISGNVATEVIGGIYSSSPLTIVNSTVAFNSAMAVGAASAAGVCAYTYTILLYSTIISNNLANGAEFDLNGYAQALGSNNLIMGSAISPPGTLTGDPQLGSLQDNGGPTWTHAITAGSIAIDAGNNPASAVFDQRGAPYLRASGAAPDIGAYEQQTINDRIFANGFDST